MGSFSWTMPEQKRRLALLANLVNLWGFDQTPTEVARDYLSIHHPRGKRVNRYQGDLFMSVSRGQPMLSVPGDYRDMVYVDLKAAYWSILNVVGWDADYYPGRFLAAGRVPSDFPLANHKPARNSLVSVGLPRTSHVWNGKRFIHQPGYNKLLNLSLWWTVQDVLHAIAAYAEALGAVYVNTDGYIVPRSTSAALMNHIEDWGLRAAVKAAGDGSVFGVGMYRLGDMETARGGFYLPPTRSIYPVNSAWLQRRFAWFAARARRTLDKNG